MPSEELDHVMPIADGGDLWDESNMSALCQACHDLKSAAETISRHEAEVPGRAAWRKRIGDY